MKILVQQFARLGDIYLTWPILNALLRQFPSAEIHLVVREKYSPACSGLDQRVVVHKMPSQKILEPMILGSSDYQASLENLSQFIDSLVSMEFDKVINLSFSPFSSYFTHLFEMSGSQVRGYTRHPDGFFNMHDDGSAYFYAQVGVERSNRYHLVDLFALIAEVELKPVDFADSDDGGGVELPSAEYMCIHVGASQVFKAIPKKLLEEMIQYFCVDQGLKVALVGSEAESGLVPGLVEALGDRVFNLVGKTTVPQVFHIISRSFLLVGPDSFAVHVASLSSTPCINLSCQYVNFWETGPLAKQSHVLWKPQMSEHSIDDIVSVYRTLLDGEKSEPWVQVRDWTPGEPRYSGGIANDEDFGWKLICSVYTGSPLPTLHDYTTYQAIESLAKISSVAIETIPDVLNRSTRQAAFELLTQVDKAVSDLERMAPAIAPLIRWFQTEKTRLGPQSVQDLVIKTTEVFQALHGICRFYVLPGDDRAETQPEGKV